MKRMLFNATQAEELRVAIVDGQKLIDLDIESSQKEQRKGSIYKGIITRIEPSLEACFVDYGTERHGFLPFKEINRTNFHQDNDQESGGGSGRGRAQTGLKEGQEILIQVDKDERGSKGAALTSFVSLAGRYLVLMPNNPRGGGVSRRIEGEERSELKETLGQLNVPDGMSLIARTAGIGRNVEELQWDLDYLLQLWTAIESAAGGLKAPTLIYQESSLVIRAIRDYFHPDIGEILIDTNEIFEQAQQFMSHVMPQNVSRVHLYQDDIPLFSRFQIEHQIETAHSRQVGLSSGGAIVIDHTEALVAIDVNSARATRGADIETTAFNTNLEAAEEVARQLRLRDLGGLIVIDFIDMENQRNQREVENRLRDSLRYDRARVQVGKISRFGLLELSRQRLRPSLGESNHIACPRCHGLGHIRGTESIALHVLRLLQEEALKGNAAQLIAQVPVDVATYLLNEKRTEVHELETRLKVSILLLPNRHLETPNYQIQKIKQEELSGDNLTPSFQRVNKPEEEVLTSRSEQTREPRQEAAVKGITPNQPAPTPGSAHSHGHLRANYPKDGILQRLWTWIVGDAPIEAVASKPSETAAASSGAIAVPQRTNQGREPRDQRRPDRQGGREPRDSREPRAPRNNAAGQGQSGEREARDNPRDGQRNDNQRDNPRNSNRNDNRPERQERPARAPRPENEQREPRNDQRSERRESPQASLIVAAVRPAIETDTSSLTETSQNQNPEAAQNDRPEQGQRRGRGQGHNGNNRRRERLSANGEAETAALNTGSSEAANVQDAVSVVEAEPARRERAPRRAPREKQEAPRDLADASEAAHASPLHQPSPIVTKTVVAAVIVAQPTASPTPKEPLVSDKDIVGRPPKADDLPSPEARGLIMVETSAGQTAPSESAATPPPAPRARRAPRRKSVIEAEPMLQVETQNGSSNHADSNNTNFAAEAPIVPMAPIAPTTSNADNDNPQLV